ncbi:FimV/HubP family polar landmark protein [Stutzerimonas zhaodongensis]|uniref:FimV/HubP family polar landmark protein n=1 Tax=Stutzerimonas zhaodongensis TaxID=1176257 RepID=UPI0039EEFE60
MALGRRVLLTVAFGSLVYSGVASALGMGDITLHSALNQPLSADIDLLDVGDLSADDVRVVLASSADFTRSGVERVDFLQDLNFTPVIDGQRSRIQVVSSKPVREPYLNFLVEITRAKSRMLREYTVLLDPLPGMPDAVSEVAVSVPQSVTSTLRTELSRIVPPAELPQAGQGKRHRVADGESLWTIASLYAGGARGTQAQFMRDIKALNPEAFAGGDAARIKAGANLLLPDSAEPAKAAIAEREPLAEPLESRPATVAVAGDAEPVDDQVANLRRQLFEELAASREENQQLKQMLMDMQVQMETVTAQLVEQRSAQSAAPQPVVQNVTQAVAEPTPAMMSVESTPPLRWQDWALPSGAVLATLLLGALWLGRRNRPKALEPEFVAPVQAQRVPNAATQAAVEMPRQPAQASVSETDVLEAADIYITYGRRDEALDVLQRGIERTPDQLDIRLRYLGLLAESGDVESYSAAAAGFLQVGGARAQLDQLLALHPALASAVAAAEPAEAEPILDPDITFVLNETLDADFLDPSFEFDQQNPSVQATRVYPAQPLIDGFDEALTLGELPSLLGNSETVEVKPTAEELRQLEPNPEHLIRLNQAVAYIKQGNMESACIILETLATEGDEAQRQQVNELLAQIA